MSRDTVYDTWRDLVTWHLYPVHDWIPARCVSRDRASVSVHCTLQCIIIRGLVLCWVCCCVVLEPSFLLKCSSFRLPSCHCPLMVSAMFVTSFVACWFKIVRISLMLYSFETHYVILWLWRMCIAREKERHDPQTLTERQGGTENERGRVWGRQRGNCC